MSHQIVNVDGLPINPINAIQALSDSETYGFVNTRSILDSFAEHGWVPVSETAVRVRKPERAGFQKHLIRLENPEFPRIEGLTDANNSKPQLCVLNAHDGTSRLSLLWGLIRVACLNGIIAGTGISGFNITHSKNITQRLPEAMDFMINNFPKFMQQIQSLQNKQLSDIAVTEFTRRIYDARLEGVNSEIVKVDYILPVYRSEDNSTDAFTVFNRAQEVLMRGGIKYSYRHDVDTGNGVESTIVHAKTRKLSSITSQVKLNQLAYDTTMELAA